MQPSSEKPAVCVLDDDISMLKALERLLKADGFRAEKFSQPSVFLLAIGQTPCRVAILDVWMPEMTGLEVQTTLREKFPETRVIFISGRDDPSLRRAALNAGAFAFLTKPFDDETLLQFVRSAIAA